MLRRRAGQLMVLFWFPIHPAHVLSLDSLPGAIWTHTRGGALEEHVGGTKTATSDTGSPESESEDPLLSSRSTGEERAAWTAAGSSVSPACCNQQVYVSCLSGMAIALQGICLVSKHRVLKAQAAYEPAGYPALRFHRSSWPLVLQLLVP